MLFTAPLPTAHRYGDAATGLIAVAHPDGATRIHAPLQPGDEIRIRTTAVKGASEFVIHRADGTPEVLMTVPTKLALRHSETVRSGLLGVKAPSGQWWPTVVLVIGLALFINWIRAPSGSLVATATPTIAPLNVPLAPAPTTTATAPQALPSLQTSNTASNTGDGTCPL